MLELMWYLSPPFFDQIFHLGSRKNFVPCEGITVTDLIKLINIIMGKDIITKYGVYIFKWNTMSFSPCHIFARLPEGMTKYVFNFLKNPPGNV